MARHSTSHKAVAKRLADLLEERDLRTEQVAAELTISHRTVTRWLAGANEPTPTMARRLGDYFGIDWREFYEPIDVDRDAA